MSEQVSVNVEILGRRFNVNTTVEDQEALHKAVSMLNNKIAIVQKAVIGWENDKIAIMASLNLSYDLLKILQDSQNQTLADSKIERKIAEIIQQSEEALTELTS